MFAWNISVGIAAIVVVVSLVTTIRAFPHYLMFFSRHLDLGLLIGLLLAIVFGVVGSDYGLSNLFWHERITTQFLAGVSLAVVILLMAFLGVLCNPRATDDIWVVVLALRRRARRSRSRRIPRVIAGPLRVVPRFWQARRSRVATARVRRYLIAIFLPIGLALTLPLTLAPLRQADRSLLKSYLESMALPLGAWLTFASAILGLSAASRGLRVAAWKRRHGWGAALLVAGSVALAASIPNGITAAMCICMLLGLVALFLFATYRMPLLRAGILIVAGIALGFTNNRDDKLTIPGMKSHYEHPIDLSKGASVEINPKNPLAQIRQASTDLYELSYQSVGGPGTREAREKAVAARAKAVEEVCAGLDRVIDRLSAARQAVGSARRSIDEFKYTDALLDVGAIWSSRWAFLPTSSTWPWS